MITPEQLYRSFSYIGKDVEENITVLKPMKDAVSEYELQLVEKALNLCKNKEEAAGKLGISLSSLTRRMRKIKQSKKDVKIDFS
ncbi:helix-turn-helix domain-containing protein [Ureibacillus endophyticus]|uniref:DNA binding HTH domain-containing protein n=1 Tax=Ureibacillus endophyticus TaxID=1978490 RepID=A0A494YY83_9BACL|nr:helix-turn-helix domain-containing protein [Lysinibacillus endophyticus]RKQ15168.1 hypothetical protein D8M03_12510 [Lysinibacillus endophyticus]